MTDARLIALFVILSKVRGDLVDRAELERWAYRLGVQAEWQQAQDFREP